MKNNLNEQLYAIDHVLDTAKSKLHKIDNHIGSIDSKIVLLRKKRAEFVQAKKGLNNHIRAIEQIYNKLKAESKP